jgi:pimeloyl-ACP methyl ester carboxylesterase
VVAPAKTPQPVIDTLYKATVAAAEDPKTRALLLGDSAGDLVGLVDVLGEKSCVLVGHDRGAVATWNAAMRGW